MQSRRKQIETRIKHLDLDIVSDNEALL